MAIYRFIKSIILIVFIAFIIYLGCELAFKLGIFNGIFLDAISYIRSILGSAFRFVLDAMLSIFR